MLTGFIVDMCKAVFGTLWEALTGQIMVNNLHAVNLKISSLDDFEDKNQKRSMIRLRNAHLHHYGKGVKNSPFLEDALDS